MSKKDSVAIVTGAARGIGLACAERFARDGHKVVLADILEDAGKTEAANLSKNAGEALFIKTDVTKEAEVKTLIDETISCFGRIDVLVNNAGVTHAADFLDLEIEEFDRVMNINLRSMVLVGQATARSMKDQGGGAIINMASVNSVLALPNQTPYVVSKGAIKQLTAVMALSLAPHNIRVNAVGPGTILTDLAKEAVMGDDAARRVILSRTPLGRFGDPAEVASAVAFLASEDASYITGQTIFIDGGRMVLNYTVPVQD